jgi:PilZ domain-containing protein
MPDVSIVVADVSRIGAIRDGLQLPGRTMHFTSATLGSAIESIRAYRPRLVAIDARFAETPAGVAFVGRVEAIGLAGSAIQLIVEHEGRWIATRSGAAPAIVIPRPQPTVAALSSALAAASHVGASNTRRAPRFLVRDPVEAVVESGRARVVDMSVLGAQIVSLPSLRPNQKIKLVLPDTDDMLNLVAQVAWSTFEQSAPGGEPHYRAGIEFAGAAQQSLEEYRARHCADQPIPIRAR